MATDRLAEASRWLTLATEDVRGAEAILGRDDVAPRLACFLAQQAAEKAIKACLILEGVEFPRIHDLVALRGLLPDDADVGVDDPRLGARSEPVTHSRHDRVGAWRGSR